MHFLSRSLICIACLTAFTAAASVTSAPAELQGTVGKAIKLSLDANPSTGYQWIVSELPAGLLLVPGSYQPQTRCQSGMTGCPGRQTFYLIGRKPATMTLKLIYGRTFDATDWKEQPVRVIIHAAAAH